MPTVYCQLLDYSDFIPDFLIDLSDERITQTRLPLNEIDLGYLY